MGPLVKPLTLLRSDNNRIRIRLTSEHWQAEVDFLLLEFQYQFN